MKGVFGQKTNCTGSSLIMRFQKACWKAWRLGVFSSLTVDRKKEWNRSGLVPIVPKFLLTQKTYMLKTGWPAPENKRDVTEDGRHSEVLTVLLPLAWWCACKGTSATIESISVTEGLGCLLFLHLNLMRKNS